MNVFVLMMVLAAGPTTNEPLPVVCSIKPPEVGQVYLETAVVEKSTPNAQEVAAREARAKLIARLCQDADCGSLEQSISPWKAGVSETSICAGAAIKVEDYEAWKSRLKTLREAFREDLHAAIAKGVEQLKTVRVKGALTVALNPVRDDDSVGGGRSRWARLALRDALGATGVVLVETPAVGPARNASVLLTAELVSLDTAASALAWQFEVNSRLVAPNKLQFPNEIAPRGGTATKRAAEHDKRLRLHIDTRTGDLCEGQHTQLWLESDRTRCVVVLDTWGETAVLMFPNASHPSCVIEGNQPVRGGDKNGFRVVGIPGIAEERYVAIAVDSFDKLPKELKKMVRDSPGAESCRLTDPQLRALDAAQPPKVIRNELSFRVLKDKTACEGVKSFTDEEAQAFSAVLDSLVDCPK
jgi:hypothetical protein